jgi:hypothetical protein
VFFLQDNSIYLLFNTVPFGVVPFQLDTVSPVCMPLLKTFAGILFLELRKCSLQLFSNSDDVIKPPLQCQHGFMGMNQKQSNSLLRGRTCDLCSLRRPDKYVPV